MQNDQIRKLENDFKETENSMRELIKKNRFNGDVLKGNEIRESNIRK